MKRLGSAAFAGTVCALVHLCLTVLGWKMTAEVAAAVIFVWVYLILRDAQP